MRAARATTAALFLLAVLAAWWLLTRRGPAPGESRDGAPAATPPPAAAPGLEARPAPPTSDLAVTAWVSGVVVDERDRPIAGARVMARTFRQMGGRSLESPLSLDGAVLASTALDGRFRVERAPTDLAALAFVAAGFAAEERGGLSTAPDARHDLRITLTRGRGLAGTVRDTEGRPIVGARVGLTGASAAGHTFPHQSVLTDREGAYAFESLSTALDRAIVTASGYRTTGFLDASTWGERKDVALARVALLVDVVEADGGEPVAGARGTLSSGTPPRRLAVLEPWPHRAEAQFPDAPGRLELWPEFVLARVEGASLECEAVVFAEGHRSARERVTLRKGQEPPHLRVALSRGEEAPSLAGVVVGGEGARLTVLLAAPKDGLNSTDEDLPALRFLPVGPEGRFSVRGLPSDRYRLRAESPGRAPATIEAEAPALSLVLEFPPTGTLEVRVVTTEGAVEVGADVAAEPVEGRTVRSARTGADGVARFEVFPAGPVDVAPGRATPQVGMVAKHPSRVRVAVEAGATTRTEVVVPARVKQVLRVVDEREAPVEGVAVRLEGAGVGGGDGEWARVKALALTTDAEGRCAAELYPGRYRCVLVLPSGAQVEPRVEVPLRAGPELVVRVTRVGVTLRGRVLEEGTDLPVVARPVFVARAGPDAPRDRLGTALTDADGRFAIAGLPAARVLVHLALRSQGERGILDEDSPWSNTRVEIDLGSPPAELVARVPRVAGQGAIERTTTLSLRVTSARGGTPLGDASAYAEALRNGLWIGAGEVRTDAEGRGRTGLLPGERYRIRVSGPRSPKATPWRPREVEAVPAGGRVEVDVALDPEDG